jgi:hypothetical protein
VVNFDAWGDAILEGLESVAQFAIYVGSEGENAQALNNAIADAFNVGADVVKAKFGNVSAADLQNSLTENFQQACQAINVPQDWAISFAEGMGLSTGWGLITGSDYQKMIHDDNKQINDGKGWSVFRAPPHATSAPDYIANHAYIQQGHLIYMWDRNTLAQWGGSYQFWLPWS